MGRDENEHLGLCLITTALKQVLLVCMCLKKMWSDSLKEFGMAPNLG